MRLLREVVAFLRAVISDWCAWVTGGVVALAAIIWQSVTETPIPGKVWLWILGSFLIVAFFDAWRKERRKSDPGMMLQVDLSGHGAFGTGAVKWFVVTVYNRGNPTVLGQWELTVKPPKRKRLIGKLLVLDGTITLEPFTRIPPHEFIYRKLLKDPLKSGGRDQGFLPFLLEGTDPKDLGEKGERYIITCRDVWGNPIKCKVMTDGTNAEYKRFLGMTEEPLITPPSPPSTP